MTLDYINNKLEVNCTNEYGKLERVVVCPPEYMQINEVINETQRYYANQNIDKEVAKIQHKQFVEVLRSNGVDVLSVPANSSLNEQVFTRDIGFVIGESLYVSNMKSAVRKQETAELQDVLQGHDIPCTSPFSHSIEGGDVIIDEETVWIGYSGRTTREAVEKLTALLPFHHIEPLRIDDDILHLDCIFNIIAADWALIYTPAFTKESLKKLKQRFNLIEVNSSEQFTMGTNVLSIGNGRIISLPENEKVNAKMADCGFEIIEVKFSEIIKSGGSFRCSSLPLLRK